MIGIEPKPTRFMKKTTLGVVVSALMLCGCAHRQEASAHRAIDSIRAGGDSVWSSGVVLHVANRKGDSIEGIRIVSKTPGGQETTLIASAGTLLPGSFANPADSHSVRITLRDVQGLRDSTGVAAETMTLVLKR